MQKAKKIVLLLILSLILPLHVSALERDSVLQRLTNRFFDLYNEAEVKEEFFEAGEQLSDYYLEKEQPLCYYKTQLNICFYETEHHFPAKAMKRASSMLEKMINENFDGYCQVYLALGTIFESRGNYRMARYYYEHSLNSVLSDDIPTQISIYSRLAFLMMLRDPIEAKEWNKKYYKESANYPEYRQVYYFIEAMINFKLNNKIEFERCYQAYLKHNKQHKAVLDNYGMETLEVAHLAITGKYEEAVEKLDSLTSTDLNEIGYLDMRIIIAKMMNRDDLALQAYIKRSECIDSLNSDMLFDNMNELNAQADVAHAKLAAAKARERMFIVTFTMAAIIIALLIFAIMHYRKSREQLSEKNNQLHSALAMAEEGEKMKSEFVRSVSHEIRTPLNAINGFNQLLNTSGVSLSETERADMLNRIMDNVQAITNIVDEMLRVADRESNEYSETETVYCNQYFPTLLYAYRDHLSSSIQLNYSTKVLNRFEITTNKEGVSRIMDQLIKNAIKFTKEGAITMHCEMTPNEKYLALSITDTGIGVRKDMQDKIFEGFSKVDKFKQGIGLGLVISKKIAHKLGGDLVLDKTYTQGARFILTLPLKKK